MQHTRWNTTTKIKTKTHFVQFWYYFHFKLHTRKKNSRMKLTAGCRFIYKKKVPLCCLIDIVDLHSKMLILLIFENEAWYRLKSC